MATRLKVAVFLSLAFLLAPIWHCASGASIKDTESATHGDEAATYQVVNTYHYPGYRLVQFNLGVLSHYSYMLISNGKALVVDPGRDVFAYTKLAQKENLKIVGVFLTHNHADFVAGHLELAKAVGCPIYASAKSGDQFPHQSLKEGSKIEVGEAVIKILETPGHTPDGLCGLVAPKKEPTKPNLILTTSWEAPPLRPPWLPKATTPGPKSSASYRITSTFFPPTGPAPCAEHI